MSRESIYRRYERGFKADSAGDDYAYWFVFCRSRLLISPDELKIPYVRNLEELDLSPVRTQYLGRLDGHPCCSAEVSPDTVAPEGMSFKEMMSLYEVLEEDIYLLAGKAVQIVNWDQTHQYCGRCGSETETAPGERAKRCPVCGFVNYPRLSPAVIIAVLKDDKLLLTQHVAFRGNMHTVIAGFVEPGETLEECVKREIYEEVGLRVKNIRYFSSQPWPYPNSLMIGFTAECESGEIAVDKEEISHAGWYGADNLPAELPPKLSIAREIIDWFIRNNSGKSR